MIPTEFTPRKIRRKLRKDSPLDVTVTAADLFTRKRVGRQLFDPLVENEIVNTVPRKRMLERAPRSVKITDDLEDTPTPFVVQIEGGYVLSETGLAVGSRFDLLEESAATPQQARQAMMAMCSRELFFGHLPIRGILTGTPPTDTTVLDTVAPLIPRYPDNYYHWMVETVPKVRYLREFEKETSSDVTVLLSADAPPFIEETLQLLGWPESKTMFAEEPIYEVRNLVVPSFPERTAADFDWLRSEILEGVSDISDAQTSGSNVYVSRANAVERRVVNEEEVMAVLSEYGFDRYLLEDRSIEENIRLFNNANLVVGPHGAGLTDIIFAEDCTLVELFGEKVKQPYEILAETLGVNYEPMYCQADTVDIVVDTGKLQEQIERIIQR